MAVVSTRYGEINLQNGFIFQVYESRSELRDEPFMQQIGVNTSVPGFWMVLTHMTHDDTEPTKNGVV